MKVKTLDLVSSWFAFFVTILTINWSSAIWFEWNFSFNTTICASDFVHFSRWSVVVTVSTHLYFHQIFVLYNNNQKISLKIEFQEIKLKS